MIGGSEVLVVMVKVDLRDFQEEDIHDFLSKRVQSFFNGAFGGDGDEEVGGRRRCSGASSSLEMLTNICLGGIMVNLIFLEGFEEEALVEFMVEFG
ncbi:hypothetical protein Tco_0539907 [Tanacetum coccineum]